MKKFVIDLSKPDGDPEREQLLDMSPEEEKALQDQWDANAAREANKPQTLEDRISALEADLQQVKSATVKGE